jgi:hypothetical protein
LESFHFHEREETLHDVEKALFCWRSTCAAVPPTAHGHLLVAVMVLVRPHAVMVLVRPHAVMVLVAVMVPLAALALLRRLCLPTVAVFLLVAAPGVASLAVMLLVTFPKVAGAGGGAFIYECIHEEASLSGLPKTT